MKILNLIILFLMIQISSRSQEERKFQFWNNNNISAFLASKTYIQLSEKIHYSPSSNNLDVKYGDLWLKHKVRNWFEYGGGMRIVSSKKVSGNIMEKRIMAIGVFSKYWKDFQFDYSNRFEYRTFDFGKNHFRNVSKITVDLPKISSLKLRFFASEETFIKLTKDNLSQLRFYSGLRTIDRKHFHLNMYYALEKSKHLNHWDTVDILGMNMNIVL